MKRLFQTYLYLCLLASGALAENKSDVLDRLHRADTLSSLNDPALKPWHLKFSFQLFDNKGKPTEQGTIEEWWRSPKSNKTIYTSPSYNGTEINTPDGHYVTAGNKFAPYLLNHALSQIVHPMHMPQDATKVNPLKQRLNAGKTPLDCIVLAGDGMSNFASAMNVNSTYCFDVDSDFLRAGYESGAIQTVRNKISLFQERQIPLEEIIAIGTTSLISAKIQELETMATLTSDFAPDAGMEKINTAQPGSNVLAGRKIKGSSPRYPESAKVGHITGTVLISAVIGSDGLVHSKTVIGPADSDLAAAAMTAVSDWVYKPYEVDGVPVEVQTVITVHFAMQ